MVTAVFALLACGTGYEAIAAEPDSCIAGQYVIGCQSERVLDDIGTFQGDSAAMRKSIFDSIVSGQCRVFHDGDTVLVIDRTFVSERRLVRHDGEAKSYWMPAKWTRPIGECSTPAPAPKVAETVREPAPPEAPVRQTIAAQVRPAVSVQPGCEIKAVMSDEDMAACRRLSR